MSSKDLNVEEEDASSDSGSETERVESYAQTAEAEAANVTSKEITKKDLIGIYSDEKFKSEVDKVFPKDTKIYEYINVSKLLNEAGIDKEFNKVFLAREPEITIDTNKKVYVYRDESGYAIKPQKRSIVILCTACVIEEDDKNYKIVIASRLDMKHMAEKENMKGGTSAAAQKIFKYIEKSSNDNNIKSYNELDEKLLNPDFTTEMSAPLTSNHTAGNNNPVFIELLFPAVNADDDIKTLTKNKIINFKVTFSIIYDEDIIYYSTKFEQQPAATESGAKPYEEDTDDDWIYEDVHNTDDDDIGNVSGALLEWKRQGSKRRPLTAPPAIRQAIRQAIRPSTAAPAAAPAPAAAAAAPAAVPQPQPPPPPYKVAAAAAYIASKIPVVPVVPVVSDRPQLAASAASSIYDSKGSGSTQNVLLQTYLDKLKEQLKSQHFSTYLLQKYKQIFLDSNITGVLPYPKFDELMNPIYSPFSLTYDSM